MTRAGFDSAIRFEHVIFDKVARGMTVGVVGSGDLFGDWGLEMASEMNSEFLARKTRSCFFCSRKQDSIAPGKRREMEKRAKRHARVPGRDIVAAAARSN